MSSCTGIKGKNKVEWYGRSFLGEKGTSYDKLEGFYGKETKSIAWLTKLKARICSGTINIKNSSLAVSLCNNSTLRFWVFAFQFKFEALDRLLLCFNLLVWLGLRSEGFGLVSAHFWARTSTGAGSSLVHCNCEEHAHGLALQLRRDGPHLQRNWSMYKKDIISEFFIIHHFWMTSYEINGILVWDHHRNSR